MMAKARKYIAWGLFALLLIWMFLNRHSVNVDVLIDTWHIPVAFVILFSAAAGAGGMYLLQVWRRVKGEQKK